MCGEDLLRSLVDHGPDIAHISLLHLLGPPTKPSKCVQRKGNRETGSMTHAMSDIKS